MSTQNTSQPQLAASPEMREPFSDISNTSTPPIHPPPAYQDEVRPVNTNRVGETYYEPPPILYPPPPLPETLDTPTLGNRIAGYYSPQNNRRLAVRRRISSCLCVIVTVAVIIGLASGLTRNAYYYSNCECQTNADCLRIYESSNRYCSNSCTCLVRS